MKKFWRLANSGNATVGSIAVAGVGAAKATSRVFPAVDKVGAEYSIGIKCSGSAPKVSIKVQASFDGTNFVVPDDMSSAVISVTYTNRHVKGLTLTKALFYRLHID